MPLKHLIDKLQIVREEIITNLSMPIEQEIKKAYLKEVINLYKDLESKIVEDDKGSLSTDFIEFENVSLNEMDKMHQDHYNAFLNSFKASLRNEVIFVASQLNMINGINGIKKT